MGKQKHYSAITRCNTYACLFFHFSWMKASETGGNFSGSEVVT